MVSRKNAKILMSGEGNIPATEKGWHQNPL
jgi:hypothetical protein